MKAFKYTFTVKTKGCSICRITVQPASNMAAAAKMLQQVARVPAGCIKAIKREPIIGKEG